MNPEDDCIILGTYVAQRSVAGRKVLQIMIEVPDDMANEALAILGYPRTGTSNWVSVARVTPEAAAHWVAALQARAKPAAALTYSPVTPVPLPSTGDTPVSEKSGAGGKGRKWSDIPYSQQAAIRAQDPDFQHWAKCITTDEATAYIKQYCQIESRVELDDMDRDITRARWRDIDDSYAEHLTDRQYSEAKRHG